ncbi:MAG: M23 family metallopeptidase, partial [Syntrophomonadaceae bacterium]|nr:M23 family metallopeptidase [Syntrophomonadaceae bacterium]
ESIELVPVRVSTPEVLSPDQALEQILLGEEQAVEYTIQEGDSLWAIARRNNLNVSDLLMANPGLNEDHLQIGQVIRLKSPAPLINVVATVETSTSLSIPFSTEVKADSEKWRGYKKVVQAGIPGSKDVVMQVVYRNGRTVEEKVLSENVVQEPKNQVEVRGTRTLVASRSDQGIGKLGWPIRGQITSYYGRRGREFHSGIDIDGVTGQPIFAAEDGMVIEAQWNGYYGRDIVIDHGGGLLTRYAHCSSINVKRGDQVSRGEVIARVGSTGKSTGSHLHFEVIVHGSTVNPLNFLR